jgi:hypothetical protein
MVLGREGFASPSLGHRGLARVGSSPFLFGILAETAPMVAVERSQFESFDSCLLDYFRRGICNGFGQGRIRTFEDVVSRFTVCPRWPLEYLPGRKYGAA